MAEQGHYSLRIIGPFGLFDPSGRRIEIPSKRAQVLLAMLATAPDGLRARNWLRERLWGSRDLDHGRASLRRELTNLRMIFRNHECEFLLNASDTRIALLTERIVIDVLSDEHAAGEFLEGIDLSGESGIAEWLLVKRRSHTDASAVKDGGEADIASLLSGAAPSLPLQPSIAVLPFRHNMQASSDAAMADFMVEDLVATLSRYSTLFVISSNSSLMYRDHRQDRRTICRELGVRYLLEGSIRERDAHLMITMQLSDGLEGQLLWAESFQDDRDRLSILQAKIVEMVAPLIDSSLERTERNRAIQRPVHSPDAHHLYWRANGLFRQWDKSAMIEAAELAARVAEIEPENAWAHALLAFCAAATRNSHWTTDPEAARLQSLASHRLALLYGGDDPFVLGYAAGTLLALGEELEAADLLIARALEIHPGNASTLFWGGWVDVSAGRLDRARERFTDALRRNPRSAVRAYSLSGIGVCLLLQGNPANAARLLREAVQSLPTYPVTLAALAISLLQVGKPDEARPYAERLRTLNGVDAVLVLLTDPAQRAAFQMALSVLLDQASA